MNNYNIAVIPGDGIGKEITPEGVRILNLVAEMVGSIKLEFEEFPWGSDYYQENGRMMPKDGLEILTSFDAIYFGAVGWPDVPDNITLHGLRLPICQGFDQYANVRPALLLPGVSSPLKDKESGDIDLVVVRENTEGEYSGIGGWAHRGLPLELAVEASVFTRKGVERLMRYAFDLAVERPAKKISCVTKSNAQKYGFVLWDEIFDEVAVEYPDASAERVLVDAMAARMVLHPESLDVLVASNLHADILTDLSGALVGSLGLAPSGNINPERTYPSMFEPIHGSAPDIYGKGVANPIAMIWSGAMMLEFLGEKAASDLILSAIKRAASRGMALTPDLGGNLSTAEVAEAIAMNMQAG
jgi:tartrate dehydrogenase/decarboxylase/D-malate dehydrogenase